MKQEFVLFIMSSRNRIHESGNEKRKKKQRLDRAAQTQKGALDKYVVKECQTSAPDQTPEENNYDKSLLSCCTRLEAALKSGDYSDIDGKELHMELKFLQEFIPKGDMGPLDILKFVKRMSCFPNALVAYRILLTIPVTVASAERSFSKLKLLKTYMRSTMTQERLNGLATIAIENDVLEKIKYEDIIEYFISKNARRMMLFNRS
jgi:hypothetical protein